MSVADNVTVVKFNERDRKCVALDKLWQYDYGQVLKITGVELPDAYEVHFSNDPNRGMAKTMTGNADGCLIPDEYLVTGQSVFAWLFLHAGNDDGATEFMVEIPVRRRAKPTAEVPTPVEHDVISGLIADMTAAAGRAQEAKETAVEAAQTAETNKDAAVDAAELARSYAEGGTGSRQGEDTSNAKYWAERAQNAFVDVTADLDAAKEQALTEITEEGETRLAAIEDAATQKLADAQASADAAAASERNAKASEDAAKDSEDAAKASEEAAALSEQNAKASEDNAKGSEDAAKLSEEAAEGAKDDAEGFATLAESYAKGSTNSRTGEDTDNAKYYMEQTRQAGTDAIAAIEQQEEDSVAAVRTEGQTQIAAATQQAQAAAGSAAAALASEQAAKDSEDAAALSEQNAADSETAALAAQGASEDARDLAEEYANRAQQVASEVGFVSFYIDENGDLIMIKTTNVTAINFTLEEGDLIFHGYYE